VPYKIVESDAGGVNVELRSRATGVAKQLHVSTAVAIVVAHLKASAEAYLGLEVHDAVVIVPDYFSEGPQDEAMDAAAEFARLTTARIIDEPTAAAVSHGIHKWLRNEGTLLVVHVGGGTTVASVLKYHDGVFEGCGFRNDLLLGGDDFDQRIVDHFVELIQKKHGLDIRNDRIALGKLRTECERAKKELSTRDVAHVRIPDTGLSEPLTRAKLEELNRDLFQRVVELVDEVEVRGSKLSENKDLIDEVLLVGGSARIPMIHRLISDYFEAKKPVTVVDPDKPDVYGGALLAQPYGDSYECMGVGGRRQYWHISDLCYPRTSKPRFSL
jgi:heat shock protein 5